MQPIFIRSCIHMARLVPLRLPEVLSILISKPGLGMDSSPINSISPSMPGLSYSAMPTSSSFGDHTVQMSSFMDISTLPLPLCQFTTFSSAQNDKVLQPALIPFLYLMSSKVCQGHNVNQPFVIAGLS